MTHDFKGPFAIEVGVGRRGGVIGELKRGAVIGVVLEGGVERFGGDAAAALLAMGALALFGEEMFERTEELGAETAAGLVRAGETAAGKNAREEILGEFASLVFGVTFAAKKGEDGIVIS